MKTHASLLLSPHVSCESSSSISFSDSDPDPNDGSGEGVHVCWPERLLSLLYDATDDALEVPWCVRLEKVAAGDVGA